MAAKFCMDCKHVRSELGIAPPRCVHPLNHGARDSVTGQQNLILWPIDLRASSSESLCGPEGRWFEEKSEREIYRPSQPDGWQARTSSPGWFAGFVLQQHRCPRWLATWLSGLFVGAAFHGFSTGRPLAGVACLVFSLGWGLSAYVTRRERGEAFRS